MAYGGPVKTQAIIEQELSELIQAHSYSEDFELLSSVRAYQEGLSLAGRDELRAVVLRRLSGEGSMVDILLCSVVDVPSAGPILAGRLDQETVPSQLTRALMTALAACPGDASFRAVERFVDSDQEGEALAALARIDFSRALPYVARALDRAHFLGPVLHLLHARAKVVGVPALAEELRASTARLPAAFPDGIRRSLGAKSAAYNPFSEAERARLLDALA